MMTRFVQHVVMLLFFLTNRTPEVDVAGSDQDFSGANGTVQA